MPLSKAGVTKVRRSEVERVALPSTVKRASAGRLTTIVAEELFEASSFFLRSSFGITFTFSGVAPAGAVPLQAQPAELEQPWQPPPLQPWQPPPLQRLWSRLKRPPWQLLPQRCPRPPSQPRPRLWQPPPLQP